MNAVKSIWTKAVEKTEGIRAQAAVATGIVVAIIIVAAVINKLSNEEGEIIVIEEATPNADTE